MEQIHPQVGALSVAIATQLSHSAPVPEELANSKLGKAGRGIKVRVSQVVNWEFWSKTRVEDMEGS